MAAQSGRPYATVLTIEVTIVHRTDDPELLGFLSLARVKQPSTDEIRDLFGDRLLTGTSEETVKFGLSINARTGKGGCGYASRTNAFRSSVRLLQRRTF